jgi:small-conductance mechanosensitive channel
VELALAWDSDTDLAKKLALDVVGDDERFTNKMPPAAVIKAITDKGPVLAVRVWTTPAHSAELGFELAAKVHAALRDAGIKGAQVS